MKNKNENIFALIGIVLLAVVARIIPHPPNFVPIGGLALFSGAHFSGKKAFIIPLMAMLVSDLFLGFHSTMIFVYLSFLLTILIGKKIKENYKPQKLLLAALGSSILFFIVTNFGVWLVGDWYPKTIKGLVESYTLAIPFFRNTVFGDLIYSFSFFYGYRLLNLLLGRLLPRLMATEAVAKDGYKSPNR